MDTKKLEALYEEWAIYMRKQRWPCPDLAFILEWEKFKEKKRRAK